MEMDIADIDRLQGAQGGSAGARPKISRSASTKAGKYLCSGLRPAVGRGVRKLALAQGTVVPTIRGRLALKRGGRAYGGSCSTHWRLSTQLLETRKEGGFSRRNVLPTGHLPGRVPHAHGKRPVECEPS